MSIAELIELDRQGFFPAPGETEGAFLARVAKIREVHREFNRKLTENRAEFDHLKLCRKDLVPEQFIAEAAELTGKLYGFAITHVPGFFLTSGVGLLWGGCMIGDPESGFSLFLIRSAFRRKTRYLCYDRRELFAHELCHAARLNLNDRQFEEHFAYQTSPSLLRRRFGNCFVSGFDAVGFVGGCLVLLLAQIVRTFWFPELWVAPFVGIAAAMPIFLLCRNALARRKLTRAAEFLHSCGVRETGPVLFRATAGEISILASHGDPAQFADLRWQIIRARFF